MRESKDWARADEIRDELTGMGVIVEDGPNGLLGELNSHQFYESAIYYLHHGST